MSSSNEEKGSSKDVSSAGVPSKEVPSQELVSTEVSTEAVYSKEVLKQNPFIDDTESTDEEDELEPRLKEPLRSWTDGTWRLPIYSSSDNDDEESEEEEEEEEAAGVADDDVFEESEGKKKGRWVEVEGPSDEEWGSVIVHEGVPADGEVECYSCAAAPDDVTMEEDPGAQVGGSSNKFRTDR